MEKIELDYEKDTQIIIDKYLDYLPEGTDKRAIVNGLIGRLSSQ